MAVENSPILIQSPAIMISSSVLFAVSVFERQLGFFWRLAPLRCVLGEYTLLASGVIGGGGSVGLQASTNKVESLTKQDDRREERTRCPATTFFFSCRRPC